MSELEYDDSENVKNISLRDVHYAISQLQSLWKQLPKTADYTLEKLYEIKTGVPSVLDDEIDDIISQIETIESHRSVERGSDPEKNLYDLRIRLETYTKLTSFQNIWEKIDEKLSRINEVWPPSFFDFRTTYKNLDAAVLSANIVENINDSIKAFNEGRFTESISNCGHATEAIVNRFCDLMEIEYEGFYAQINAIKKHLESKSIPPAGLEWYVLFLISVGYWLRNAEAHKEGTESRILPWMDDHRKKQIKRVENARVALVCTLQAANELQKIIEMNKYIKSDI